MSQSPFKFLDSYTKDDKDIFFGREREIEELYHKVFESKTLLIYGISGTGKTSLINCGLANKFNDTDWLPISIRRGKDMVQSLMDELSAVEGSTVPKKAKNNQDRIQKALRSIYLDHFKPIYLLFDQFEEVFIFGTTEERKEFANIIKSIAESDLSCKMLFSIREEYLASLTEFEEFIPNILQNRFRVERMNRNSAIRVIEGPCERFGIDVEDGFSNSLLDRLSEGGLNIELTYLQVYLDKIYRTASTLTAREERPKQPERSGARRSQSAQGEKIASPDKNVGITMTFSVDILNQIGDIKDLLGTFLNEQIAKMENPKIANAILKSFVSAKGTKKQLSIEEATESVQIFNPDVTKVQIKEYIVNFVNLRILRGEDDEGRYELRHDSLAAKIFEKISADEMELLEVRQFIENALVNFNKRNILLSTDDLKYIGERENRIKLSSELHEFIDLSKANIKAKNRTVKRLTFISAVALTLIIIALGKFIRENDRNSSAEKLSYLSILQYKDIEQRIKTANQAFEIMENVATHEALIKAFNLLSDNTLENNKLDSISKHYFRKFEPAPEKIIHAECIKGSDDIFGYTRNYVLVWGDNRSIKHKFKHNKEVLLAGKISANEGITGLLGNDSILTIYSNNGAVLFNRKIYYNMLNPVQSFLLTDKNQVVTNSGNDVVILDSLGKTIQTLQGHIDRVNALSISNNGKFIASVAFDTTANIWYYNSNKQLYSLYNSIRCHRDTIWSVNFSNRFRYIITSSKDSYVIVRDFNNTDLIPFQGDSTYCYAEFSANDFGVISRRYRFDNGQPQFEDIGDYINKFSNISLSQGSIEFKNLHFSPTTSYYSYTLSGKVFIASTNIFHDEIGNFLVYDTEGNDAFFSNNGNYLYVIKNDIINPIFVSADSINQIIKEYSQK